MHAVNRSHRQRTKGTKAVSRCSYLIFQSQVCSHVSRRRSCANHLIPALGAHNTPDGSIDKGKEVLLYTRTDNAFVSLNNRCEHPFEYQEGCVAPAFRALAQATIQPCVEFTARKPVTCFRNNTFISAWSYVFVSYQMHHPSSKSHPNVRTVMHSAASHMRMTERLSRQKARSS